MNKFRTYLIHFPTNKIKEVVYYDPIDDFYSIFIEANLSRTEQEIEFFHALRHIERGDFFRLDPADVIEAEAHSLGGVANAFT